MPPQDDHEVIAQVTGVLTLAGDAVYQRLSTRQLQHHRPATDMLLQKGAPCIFRHWLTIGQHLEWVAGGGDIFG